MRLPLLEVVTPGLQEDARRRRRDPNLGQIPACEANGPHPWARCPHYEGEGVPLKRLCGLLSQSLKQVTEMQREQSVLFSMKAKQCCEFFQPSHKSRR